MFRLFRFVFRTVVLIKLMALAFGLGMGAAYLVQLRAQYRTWGVVTGARERAVAGDDLVAEADIVETRAIDIDAPPDRVWPWLAQLGYGRGGWYSFAAVDRAWTPAGGPPSGSADTILEEYQDLAEGDLVPTHPQGGFVVRTVEPNEALVLFLDDEMMREQIEELASEAADAVEEQGGDADIDVDLSSMPPYRVTLAFELEELPGGRTRLIERVRASVEVSESQKRARPVLAMGLFVFLKSQLEGIKDRAESAVVEA
ncbi:MAG: hypothetical protein AB1Z67_03760 [Candidatus Limnocylindrales bacterium]